MTKILFFGLGNVATVMSQCLFELNQRAGAESSFVFVVRNKEKAEKSISHMQDVRARAVFVEAQNFEEVARSDAMHTESFSGVSALVNTAAPSLNVPLMGLAARLGVHYADLASDMYNPETLSKMQFDQDGLDSEFSEKNLFALINIGISPGITNFLIGERLLDCDETCQKNIASICLYLLENIRSSEIVFSWSPQVAFDELEQKPRFFRNNSLEVIEPFSHSTEYEFPHFKEPVEQYPIYQEEILSLHQTYPGVSSIRLYSGGSEVELVKNLFQLNLLSKDDPVCKESGMSIESIVRGALPGLKSSEEVDALVRNGVIKSAQFAAMAEITKGDVVEVTGLSFHRYATLSNTPYRGATYVAYPTGVGAATLLFYTLSAWDKDHARIRGVVRAEELPRLLGSQLSEMLKIDLTRFGIDLVSHVHSTNS